MGIIRCVERSSEAPQVKDAVWVPNGDKLYYPHVSSCVTVTLVFENGLLGGHASQVAADKRGDFRQASNLQDVIGRMKNEDPGKEKRGDIRRIYFIGLVETKQWEFDQAMKVIAENFGPLKECNLFRHDRSPAEIVFDGAGKNLYMLASGLISTQNVTQAVALVEQIGANESYYA
jgi:hypothetical protein